MQPDAIYVPSSSSLPASQGHSHISAVLLGLRLHQQQQQQQQQPQNETAAPSGRGGGEDEGDGYDSDAESTMKQSVKSNNSDELKRQKRLALNRKAAHESRRRKKVKFLQLTQTLETLRSENGQVESKKDAMRQKLDIPQPNKFTAEREALQSENTSLRMALLTALQGLSDQQPTTQEAETEAEATP